ncbi:MAG: hypothetical protein M1830_002719 [Pleopsidium flavum]|nr:MAG: hypothetical protein M1830_002719 [Pleopsidium flavum]
MPAYAGDALGLTANQCWPRDGYYLRQGAYGPQSYAAPPPAAILAGKTPPTKRNSILDPDEGIISVDEGNSTRLISDEELEEYCYLRKCDSQDCQKERENFHSVLVARGPIAVQPTDVSRMLTSAVSDNVYQDRLTAPSRPKDSYATVTSTEMASTPEETAHG